ASTTVGVPPFRKLLSVGARFVSRTLLGDLVARDVSCGYRLYRVELIQRALAAYGDQLIVSPGFSVNLELLAKLVKIGAKVDQVPLRLRYDLKGGESKIRIVRTVLQYLKLIVHLTLTNPAPSGKLPPKKPESSS
ncbi:hypothetical protein KDL45_16840, partial [bacterium]|nr:hypothetical protein [bacterium]